MKLRVGIVGCGPRAIGELTEGFFIQSARSRLVTERRAIAARCSAFGFPIPWTATVEALEAALARYGTPEIFNSDQEAQFISEAFTRVLKHAGVTISMDGKGRWVDDVFIERLA